MKEYNLHSGVGACQHKLIRLGVRGQAINCYKYWRCSICDCIKGLGFKGHVGRT